MSTYYDIALSLQQEYFSSRIRELCGQFELSFFLVEPVWAQEFLRKLQSGEVKARVLIDMVSDPYEPDNIYYKIAKEVKNQKGYVIDDPDLGAIMGHKSKFHKILLENQVPVPETIVVERTKIDRFRLSDKQKQTIGVPFVVKPAWGSGKQGVHVDASSEDDLIKSAAEAPVSDSFLIQRKVTPKNLDGHTGWFRVFHIYGEIIPCWWEPPTNQYQIVTPLQERTYKLAPLSKIVKDIAKVSKINFFSTEIALCEDNRFLAIDYLNTECDMSVKSFWPTGVPDELVRHVAWTLVDHAMTVARRRRGPFDDELEMKDQDWAMRRQLGRLLPGE
ncbi:MAG: hypothetical protein L0177_12480 [Chloroflexi bacterium]|nr:hypothetical protein [Chloroflexota bacterium]